MHLNQWVIFCTLRPIIIKLVCLLNISGKKRGRLVGIFFFFFFSTQTTEMHILAVIMFHQHKVCVYKGKRKLKLLITCANFVLFVLYQFLFCFVTISLEIVEKD